jgi:hypothetical protein
MGNKSLAQTSFYLKETPKVIKYQAYLFKSSQNTTELTDPSFSRHNMANMLNSVVWKE